ncbi:hypothetical protein A3Q56_06167 [Intoshia linei]|uniref:Uncharacterized protein n=1 Tax=Intoshia linei TaxID=1819745 RepID=A0A177AXJ9_9BILA|nr:hypothetical protein A3Q56_06167 [Intoshia linei]
MYKNFKSFNLKNPIFLIFWVNLWWVNAVKHCNFYGPSDYHTNTKFVVFIKDLRELNLHLWDNSLKSKNVLHHLINLVHPNMTVTAISHYFEMFILYNVFKDYNYIKPLYINNKGNSNVAIKESLKLIQCRLYNDIKYIIGGENSDVASKLTLLFSTKSLNKPFYSIGATAHEIINENRLNS